MANPRVGPFIVALAAAACGRSHGDERTWDDASAVSLAPSAEPVARPGMVWIPSGVLRAGRNLDDVPRVADAELPGTYVPLTGFYIDVLPWPNESGAIPATNVSRDEAQRLCNGQGKRLCSELEWERACKGQDSSRFEYGDAYDPSVCEAGASLEASSQRPSGQRPACRSSFGVYDMHGGGAE